MRRFVVSYYGDSISSICTEINNDIDDNEWKIMQVAYSECDKSHPYQISAIVIFEEAYER